MVVALVLGLVVAACTRGEKGPVTAAKPTAADSADQILFGSRTLITDLGLQRAEILTDTTLFYDQNTRMDMRVVRAVFFSSAGAKEGVMTSDFAIYNTSAGILEARGHVVINTIDGRRMVTPFLKYDQRINQISSDSAFTLTTPDKTVQGVGFVSDPDMQNINVKKVVRMNAGTVALPNK
jgi:LPS export ABC transporter protein LptC